MQFSGKSVIITGAGKGIGRACAKIMAERGADVIALSRMRHATRPSSKSKKWRARCATTSSHY
ncbi:hypothetical protein ASF29_03320 [Rhizobium sp. Leaf262]|nr:hypothetical protein ASF29_03320 [Rhizobium sp. Leaf262]